MKTISPGHHLIRLTLISNTNIGALSGHATLDRPTQVDAYYGLPFLPNSAIRGVLRDACAASPDDKINKRVQHFFGSSNRITSIGDDNYAGHLIIGNGDILAFPVLSFTGERCWVFPRINILKFLHLEGLTHVDCPELSSIINRLTQYERDAVHVFAAPELPPFSAPFTIKQMQAEVGDTAGKLLALVSRWAGKPFPGNETIIVADERTSGYLWQQAAEVRNATALKNNTKAARAQSLRRIETIPQDAIFCSFFTLIGEEQFQFPLEILQIGSAEGSGLGYCRLAVIPATFSANEEDLAPPGANQGRPKKISENYKLMHRAYEAIFQANKEDQKFRDKLATAIGDFGWRLHNEGLEATIAFTLAKSKPAIKEINKRKPEKRAYEWLGKYLLNIDGDLRAFNGLPWFTQPFERTFAAEVLSRWQWLRRASELELQTTRNLRHQPFAHRNV